MLRTLVLYASKPMVISFLPELESILLERGIGYISYPIDPHLPSFDDQKKSILSSLDAVDFAICLGGDGTVLAVSSILYSYDIPILPVNFGHLGFIAEETGAQTIRGILDEITEKKIVKEKRTLLQTFKESSDFSYTALNEVYIGSNNFHRVASFSISVQEATLSQYRADGILVSTATGSTGYNLSAGGPILYPTLDAFILNSVVPHNITHRPLILPPHVTITVTITNEFPQSLVVDGQHKGILHPIEKLFIRKSPHTITLMYSAHRNYFQSLNQKLHWMS